MVSRVKGKRQSNKKNTDFAQATCTEMDIAAFYYWLLVNNMMKLRTQLRGKRTESD